MIRNLAKISGVAAFAAIAATASAEVKLNDYLSIDGYATAAARVTEGTTSFPGIQNGSNQVQIENNSRTDDSAKLALNGKYEDFTAKVSGLLQNGDNYLYSGAEGFAAHNFGLLDAYVTYKTGDLAITAGKFYSFLGYESFDSPNNAFISHSTTYLQAYYGTGVKTEYTTKDYSTGISVRDANDGASYIPGHTYGGKFHQGDYNFGNGLGYEAYFRYTGIEKLQIFVGAGFENPNEPYGSLPNYDLWASYSLTDKLNLALEVACANSFFTSISSGTTIASSGQIFGQVHSTYSSNFIATYTLTDAFSVSGRIGGSQEDKKGSGVGEEYARGFSYGLASSYRFTKNFYLKSEVTKNESFEHHQFQNNSSNIFSYALQAVVQF